MDETNRSLLDDVLEAKDIVVRLIDLPLLLFSDSKKSRKYGKSTIYPVFSKLSKVIASSDYLCEDKVVTDFCSEYYEYIEKGRYSDASKMAQDLFSYLLREEQDYRKRLF